MANASMTKGKGEADEAFLHSLLHFGLYKPSQGRITRQVTAAALLAVVIMIAWRIYGSQEADWVRYGVALPVLGLGSWLSYRLVQYPKFANFLIAVESEMHKVSWPTWTELMRASMVVIISMAFLAMLLFGFDVFWRAVFQAIGVL